MSAASSVNLKENDKQNVKENILSFLELKTNEYQERISLGMKDALGWSEFTYSGLALMAKTIASYLINDLKVKRQEHVVILSESRIEFGAAFFASVIAGTTFIPLDIKLTINELTSIIASCEPTTVFVSNAYLNTVLKLKEENKSIKNIILLDNTGPESEFQSIYNLELKQDTKFRHRSLKSNALIIYTSGTTGKPKGVQTTFANLFSQVVDLKYEFNKLFPDKERINALSILPMNHLFELTVGFAAFLNLGYSIYYTKSLRPKDVLSVMRDKKIKFMITVPSFFKMLKMQFESDISKQSLFKRLVYNFNFHYVAKFLPFKFLKKYLFKNIHEKFGNKFYGFLCGGAPIDLEMAKYFNRIGIKVFQGYGLSEASPVVAFNVDRTSDILSVGKVLKSYEAKTDPETGELLVRGPAVMKGYYKQEDLTKEVIDSDNWLHTGDIAKITPDGYVYITGRIKNLIVLAGGKKVFPEEVEAVIDNSELIKECCVFSSKKTTGEKKGTEEVAIIAVAKDELFEKYDFNTIKGMLTAEIKKLSLNLTQYKRPTAIIISKEELPKTATRKIKRKEVKELAIANGNN